MQLRRLHSARRGSTPSPVRASREPRRRRRLEEARRDLPLRMRDISCPPTGYIPVRRNVNADAALRGWTRR